MYLPTVQYQMQYQIESRLPQFHKSHRKNLALMVVGMAYQKSVQLPQIAQGVGVGKTQIEGRVQRFERVVQCPKLEVLEALQPTAIKVLQQVSRGGKRRLVLVLDRSLVNDTVNLLWVAVAFEGRALPLGWVEVEHEGSSDLALQQELLRWVWRCVPLGAEVVVVADREFRSIHLATWIAQQLQWHYILRCQAGTWLEVDGTWVKAGDLAGRGEERSYAQVKVTKEKKATQRVNLCALWDETETEPWLLLTDLAAVAEVKACYGERFWIEEMFSDHKSRGLNLEKTRLTDPARLQRLLVAVTLTYLWVLQIGFQVVQKGWWRQVDNRGQARSVSLCQIGLRWLTEERNAGRLPPLFTLTFAFTNDP